MDLSNYKPLKLDGYIEKITDVKWLYKRIESFVNYFETILKESEILVSEVLLNDGSTVIVKTFGFYQPDLITIDGYDLENKNVFLLLSQNSFQLKLYIISKEKIKDTEKYKIGFQSYAC